jgi:octanoyl-[GcvH]:protein N-octanoyltransferase
MKGGWRVVSLPGVCTIEVALARQQALADQLASPSAMPLLMVWRCQRSLLVSRTETRLPFFEEASFEMAESGWPVFLRKSGGAACPVGPGTVQISMIEAAAPGATMAAKYQFLAALIQAKLRGYRIMTRSGLVAGAYCPGTYDLGVEGKKIAGMSQNWFRNRCATHCVVTAASINIEESPDALAAVVNRFYNSAGSPIRCQPAVLTNMRLCRGKADLAGQGLAAAVVNKLGRATICPGR